MYSDDYIEHWGAVYLANPVLAAHYVQFELFLEMPDYYLRHYLLCPPQAHAYPTDIPEFLPLLESQRAVMVSIMQADRNRPDPESIESYLMADKDCHVCGGAYIEPLHHHSYRASRARHVGRP